MKNNQILLTDIYKQLKLNSYANKKDVTRSLNYNQNHYTDLSNTPFYLGNISLNKSASMGVPIGTLKFGISQQYIKISNEQGKQNDIELVDWLLQWLGIYPLHSYIHPLSWRNK